VDDGDPLEASGRLLARDDRSVTVEVHGSGTSWYDGVRAARHLVVADGYLLDVVLAAADRPRRLTLGMRPGVAFDARIDGTVIRSSWRGTERLEGAHIARATGSSGPVEVRATVRPGPGPADDPQCARAHLDWTAEDAARVLWVSVLHAASGAGDNAGDAATGIEVHGTVIRVIRADGTTDVHLLPPELAYD
jgi:hypothetical protein